MRNILNEISNLVDVFIDQNLYHPTALIIHPSIFIELVKQYPHILNHSGPVYTYSGMKIYRSYDIRENEIIVK